MTDLLTDVVEADHLNLGYKEIVAPLLGHGVPPWKGVSSRQAPHWHACEPKTGQMAGIYFRGLNGSLGCADQ